MRVLVPLADGFEDIEMAVIVDVLRRAQIEVVVAGLHEGPLEGARGIKVTPDLILEEVSGVEFDMIAIPGGQPGVDNLRNNEQVLHIVKTMMEQEKWIAAICAAPLVLRDADILSGKSMTSYPGLEKEFQEAVYSQAGVVVDGNVITSRAPGTAMDFALKLVEVLIGESEVSLLKEALYLS